MSTAGRSGAGELMVLRRACVADIPAMHRVRMSVRENMLTSMVLTERDYVAAIELNGRGWVVEAAGEVVGLAIGNARTGSVWALFVHPDHEGRGYGRLLHDRVVDWLASYGHRRLWLTTTPGTRAQRFYEAAGWTLAGPADHGEVLYERFGGG